MIEVDFLSINIIHFDMRELSKNDYCSFETFFLLSMI